MELHSEALSASIITEIINLIIEKAIDETNNEETSELIFTSSDKENQSKPDEDDDVVKNGAINELTSSSDEMIDDESKKEIPSSSEEKTQLIDHVENVNGEAISGDGGCEALKVVNQEMNDGKRHVFQKVERENGSPSSSEEVIQLIDHVENVHTEAISRDGGCEALKVDNQGMNGGKGHVFQKIESKNESPSSSEEQTQLIDHVQNVIEEAISGDGSCEALKVDNQEMNYGKNHVFQKIGKSTDIAPGDINNAAVDDANNNHPSGNESNAITVDVRFSAKIEANEGYDFYSNQLLRSKGFTLNSFDTSRILTNLSLYSSTVGCDFKNCEVSCTNLPSQTMENHLIPLFEKAGKVYQLRMIVAKENRDMVVQAFVTYTKKEDAEKAIKMLDRWKVKTQCIRVEKYIPFHRIFVKGIPKWATKPQLFDKFNYLTPGLDNVLLFDSLENAGQNRGYCFLDYVDNRKARNAKKFISKTKIFGQQMISDWARRRVERTKDPNESSTLHISNLHSNLHSSDLRKLFSVYGEVCEIDKNSNYADVVFRNPEDSQRAAREINKKLLGNDNVEISSKFKLLDKFTLRRKFKIKRKNQKPNAYRRKTGSVRGSVTTTPKK